MADFAAPGDVEMLYLLLKETVNCIVTKIAFGEVMCFWALPQLS